MWLLFAFMSAFFLGVYDFNKKLGLQGNALIPALLLNTVLYSLFFLPAILLSRFSPGTLEDTAFYVPQVDLNTHLHILLKSVIVLISWGGTYIAIKHLPITLVDPIKAMQPAVVLIGAMTVFGDRLNMWQWLGVIVALSCFFLFSLIGKKENGTFWTNKWIWFLFLSVISGAISGLYDKYLIVNFDRMAIQVWYTVYQVIIMIPILFIFWYPKRKENVFHWRWSLIGISFFLCLSDFLYFYTLSLPGSMISLVAVIRRSGVIFAFAGGALFLHEKNIKIKAIVLTGVLLGMFLLFLGSI